MPLDMSSGFYPHHLPSFELLQDFIAGATILRLGEEVGVDVEVLDRLGANQVVHVSAPSRGASRAGQGAPNESRHLALTAEYHELPFPDHSFDIIFVFEALTGRGSLDLILSELKRVLSAEGFVVLTVPNFAHDDLRELLGDGHMDVPYTSPAHLHECLQAHFERVSVMIQSMFFGYSMIEHRDDDSGTKPFNISYDLLKGEPEPPLFYTFLASDLDIVLEEDRLVQVPFTPIVDRIQDGLRLYHRLLDRRNLAIMDLQQELRQNREEIREQQSSFERMNQNIQQANQDLDELANTLNPLIERAPESTRVKTQVAAIQSRVIHLLDNISLTDLGATHGGNAPPIGTSSVSTAETDLLFAGLRGEAIEDRLEKLNQALPAMTPPPVPAPPVSDSSETTLELETPDLFDDLPPFRLPGPASLATALRREVSELRDELHRQNAAILEQHGSSREISSPRTVPSENKASSSRNDTPAIDSDALFQLRETALEVRERSAEARESSLEVREQQLDVRKREFELHSQQNMLALQARIEELETRERTLNERARETEQTLAQHRVSLQQRDDRLTSLEALLAARNSDLGAAELRLGEAFRISQELRLELERVFSERDDAIEIRDDAFTAQSAAEAEAHRVREIVDQQAERMNELETSLNQQKADLEHEMERRLSQHEAERLRLAEEVRLSRDVFSQLELKRREVEQLMLDLETMRARQAHEQTKADPVGLKRRIAELEAELEHQQQCYHEAESVANEREQRTQLAEEQAHELQRQMEARVQQLIEMESQLRDQALELDAKKNELASVRDELQKAWKRELSQMALRGVVPRDAPSEGMEVAGSGELERAIEQANKLHAELEARAILLTRAHKELELKSSHNRNLQEMIGKQREDMEKIKGKIKEAIDYIARLHQSNREKDQELEQLRRRLRTTDFTSASAR